MDNDGTRHLIKNMKSSRFRLEQAKFEVQAKSDKLQPTLVSGGDDCWTIRNTYGPRLKIGEL